MRNSFRKSKNVANGQKQLQSLMPTVIVAAAGLAVLHALRQSSLGMGVTPNPWSLPSLLLTLGWATGGSAVGGAAIRMRSGEPKEKLTAATLTRTKRWEWIGATALVLLGLGLGIVYQAAGNFVRTLTGLVGGAVLGALALSPRVSGSVEGDRSMVETIVDWHGAPYVIGGGLGGLAGALFGAIGATSATESAVRVVVVLAAALLGLIIGALGGLQTGFTLSGWWLDNKKEHPLVAKDKAQVRAQIASAQQLEQVGQLEQGKYAIAASRPITSVAWSPDGTQIAAGEAKGIVEIWDVTQKRVRHMFVHRPEVRGVAWSPDGRRLATIGPGLSGDSFQLWDTSNWQKLAGYRSGSDGVAWSPDGAMVALSGYKTLLVWDVSANQVCKLSGHSQEVRGVAWSPDGQWLASAGAGFLDHTVRIWDIASEGQLCILYRKGAAVQAVAWSPDSKFLAWGGYGYQSIPIWDVGADRLLFELEGQIGAVSSLAWSPDGKWLAATAIFSEPVVRVWDVAGRKLAYVLVGHLGRVNSAAWSPDGALLATGSDDGIVQMWAMSEE